MILAVGYRVRSLRGTQFRQWATARLSEYLLKGFTMDDERLKNPPGPGMPDYFDELLELDQEKLLPLLRLKYQDSIADALADLGRPEDVGEVFAGGSRNTFIRRQHETVYLQMFWEVFEFAGCHRHHVCVENG